MVAQRRITTRAGRRREQELDLIFLEGLSVVQSINPGTKSLSSGLLSAYADARFKALSAEIVGGARREEDL
jgi:hypothetical protein